MADKCNNTYLIFYDAMGEKNSQKQSSFLLVLIERLKYSLVILDPVPTNRVYSGCGMLCGCQLKKLCYLN